MYFHSNFSPQTLLEHEFLKTAKETAVARGWELNVPFGAKKIVFVFKSTIAIL